MKKIAFYGGSFDPVHNGHLAIACQLTEIFKFDEFVFVPAFHAPHKREKKVSSAIHRYAMLALATQNEPKIKISTLELDAPEKPYTVETQTKLKNDLRNGQIFFVIGADSWAEINTWREWEKVLTLTNVIVVARPKFEISFAHVTEEIRKRIVDLRAMDKSAIETIKNFDERIYITDDVYLDVSASEIRRLVSEKSVEWQAQVPPEIARYIEKYELYI